VEKCDLWRQPAAASARSFETAPGILPEGLREEVSRVTLITLPDLPNSRCKKGASSRQPRKVLGEDA